MIIAVVVFGALGAGSGCGVGAAGRTGQGAGDFNSLTSLSSIFAPLIFTSGLFSYFTSDAAPFKLPGATFFPGTVLSLTKLAAVMRLFERIPAAQLPPTPTAKLKERQ